ncbi:TIGR03617 family F420-dependent LLM class oxidoreductase [Chloroflexota bacterium]
MYIDAIVPPISLEGVPSIAKAAEEIGFDALWCSETIHDPFLPGALISEHSKSIHFGTAVAIAFARSPANLAYTAWDLSQTSGGRFILGLGTQVKAHVERRFGMPWPESVVSKFREQIEAVRAFWKSWQTGEPLKFRGGYYNLSLMSPFFNPGPIEYPEIPIYIAGLNSGLANLAGELSDGFLVHPLHTVTYLKEILIPAIENGAYNAGRSSKEVKISATAFAVTSSEEDFFVRAQIAFYASTPSYRRVMNLHGWDSVADNLSGLAKRGKWAEMPGLINDEILETFAVISDQSEIAAGLMNRYDGIVDRLNLYLPFTPGKRDPFWKNIIKGVGQPKKSI